MGDGYGSTNLNSPEKERKTKEDRLNAIAFSVYTLHFKSKVNFFKAVYSRTSSYGHLHIQERGSL